MACESLVSFPMNGGDGLYSYKQNSSYQRRGVETAKALISEAIAEKLDVKQLISSSSSSKLFSIADLGCSVGPNTFIAVQNIIESVKNKYQSYGPNSEALEFQVFFNDQSSNDFNTLFKSIPSDGQYFAAGVPGLFQGRLFPKASLHFVHSSYTLHWLSKVPKEVVDKNSPAWNKGRIYYTSASNEVIEAYSSQFANHMESFLHARAEELVCGGLVALVIPCLPDGTPPSQCINFAITDLLGASLMDMANMGLISETKVDSFNIPKYHPTPKELETLIEKNASFSVERMEPLYHSTRHAVDPNIQMLILHIRAVYEELIKDHFGNDIIDELFDRFRKKVVESSIFSETNYKHMVELFVLLKRKII